MSIVNPNHLHSHRLRRLLSDLSVCFTVLHMVGRFQMNDWLPDMTPFEVSFDDSGLQKTNNNKNKTTKTNKQTNNKKRLILIRLRSKGVLVRTYEKKV